MQSRQDLHEVRPIIRPCPFESDPAAISYLAAYTPRSTLNQQFYSIEKQKFTEHIQENGLHVKCVIKWTPKSPQKRKINKLKLKKN